MPRRPRFPIAIPYPHFMAFAPLDVWARLLMLPPAWVPPRYWPRLAFALFTSALGTAITLPERLLLAPILWLKTRRGAPLDHPPGIVIILGYFRSGTTHLHYLLSCDPRFRTPRWYETIAPQGFVASWTFLRWLLIPFLSAKRPQDDVAFGPEWPAEDDFALNNWALASSLPGRFVTPRLAAHYARFHDLEGLAPRELERWRRCQWAFCWKLAASARRRAILLKTPSHTARVEHLIRLFGPDRVKFIHISRDPGAVLRSNIAMHGRLEMYNLQDPPHPDHVEDAITAEYASSEESYIRAAATLPRGHVCQLRYEDLITDPLGELRRIYDELGLPWSDALEARAVRYLDSVRDYRAATQSIPPPSGARRAAPALPPRLQALTAHFGHDRPARPKVQTPTHLDPALQQAHRDRRGLIAAATAALMCIILWLELAYIAHDRYDWLVWPVGAAIGAVSIRAARVGSTRLGLAAAALTLLVMAAISLPATYMVFYAHRRLEWYHLWKSTRVGFFSEANAFWVFMGMLTAYRFASRRHVHPPGGG